MPFTQLNEQPRKIAIIALAVTGIVTCLSVPLLTPDNNQQAISSAAALLSALSAIITMTLAIFLFNRFGVEQDVLKHQFDSVLSLLRTLRAMRFLMKATDKGGEMILQVTPFDPFAHQIFEMHYGKVIAFNEHTIRKLEPLGEHLNDVFLPTSIVDALDPLVPIVLQTALDQNEKLTKAIHFAPWDADDTVFLSYNGVEMTLMDFLLKWSELIDAIDAWVQQNAANGPVLNIKHLTKKDAQTTSESYSEIAPSASSETVT